MQVWKRISIALALGTTLLATTGCGTISTLGKLEKGAGSEASRMWDRWIEGNGDIATALRSNPAVQFNDTGRSSRNMGEIRPDDFSINGAPYYQNLFLLDGATINNDIDPAVNADSPGNVNNAVDVPSASQGIAVDGTAVDIDQESDRARASDGTVLLVSHDLDLARQTTHRQWHIEQGRLHMG